MAAQSFAMGEAFGKGFQYGKRRVSSMTNEQFNATSAVKMFEETTADINGMIPAMKSQMATFALLQSDIIKEMIGYIRQLPADVYQGLTGGEGSPFTGTNFSAWMVNPSAIEANFSVWKSLGLISDRIIADYYIQKNLFFQNKASDAEMARLTGIIQNAINTERFGAPSGGTIGPQPSPEGPDAPSPEPDTRFEEELNTLPPPQSTIDPTTTKRQAGQSQYLEEKTLKDLIYALSVKIQKLIAARIDTTVAKARLADHKQALANLYARYIF